VMKPSPKQSGIIAERRAYEQKISRLTAERDALRAELAEARRTWPRCKCGGLLRWRYDRDPEEPVSVVECVGCGKYMIRSDTDSALAAFRAAEQEGCNATED